MAFKSVTQIKSDSGILTGRGRERSGKDIVIATDKNAVLYGKQTYSLRISMSTAIAKKARIMAGDRVEFFIDSATNPPSGLLKRTNQGGLKLYGSKKDNARLIYKSAYMENVGMPSFKEPEQVDAVVIDDGVLFDIPASCSFEKNLRLESEDAVASNEPFSLSVSKFSNFRK